MKIGSKNNNMVEPIKTADNRIVVLSAECYELTP